MSESASISLKSIPIVTNLLTVSAKLIDRYWWNVRAFLDGLRVAWVSTASVIFALFLFLSMPQTQDLFLEVRGSSLIGSAFWAAFYLSALVIWAFPVYLSSRWILGQFCRHDSELTDQLPIEPWVYRILPALLATSCFLSILIGQMMALSNAPRIDQGLTEIEFQGSFFSGCNLEFDVVGCVRTMFQVAQNSAAEFSETTGPETIVFLIYIGIAVIIASYFVFKIARYIFSQLSTLWRFVFALIASLATVPLSYFILGLLIWIKSRKSLFSGPPTIWKLVGKIFWWMIFVFVFLLAIVVVVFILVYAIFISAFLYGFALNELNTTLGVGHLALLPAITVIVGLITWILLRPRKGLKASKLGTYLLMDVDEKKIEIDHIIASQRLWTPLFYIFGLGSLGLILIQLFVHPVLVTDYIYRGLLFPFFLGILIPLVTYVTQFSFRWHAPILLIVITVFSVVSLFRIDSSEVRTVDRNFNRPTLEQSVQRWARVNNCDLNTPENCPPPIVVSAAGGASRAGFLVSSVLGKLLDENDDENFHQFSKQLFAISGVSGGSLGAVVTYAALADSKNKSKANNGIGQPPCKKEAHDTEWFGPHVKEDNRDKSWRDCLQLIVSGDFLSPVFIDLVAGDLLSLNPRQDRAETLENAWEMRYARLTNQTENATLEQSIVNLRKWTLEQNSEDWLPILFLNGTSVSTGRRIITSDVDTTLTDVLGISKDRLFRDAYDLHELFEEPIPRMERVIFSPDGKFMLLSNQTGADQLWNIETGKLVGNLDSSGGAAKFSDDGNHLIKIDENDGAVYWDTVNFKKLWRVQNVGNYYGTKIQYLDDSNRILVRSEYQADRLIDTLKGKLVQPLDLDDETNSKIRISNDLNYAIKLNDTAEDEIWDLRAEKLVGKIDLKFGDSERVYFSPDNKSFFAIDDQRRVSSWSLDSGKQLYKLGTSNSEHIMFSADGKRFMTSSVISEGDFPVTVQMFDTSTGDEISDFKQSFSPRLVFSQFENVTISDPESRFVLTYSDEGGLSISSLNNGNKLGTIHNSKKINRFDFIPNDKDKVFIGTMTGDFSVWDVITQEELNSVKLNGEIEDIQFSSANNNIVFIKTSLGQAMIWNFRTGNIIRDFTNNNIVSFKYHRDKDRIITVSRQDFVRVWELSTGNELAEIKQFVPLNSDAYAEFHPDGNLVVTKVDDQLPRIWDLNDNTEKMVFPSKGSGGSPCWDCRDVRLSTAATMSARFPLISPHGSIKNSKDKIVDRVVDGGYYENFGAATAIELVEQLFRYNLKPRIIMINNEPTTTDLNCVLGAKILPIPEPAQNVAFSFFLSPLSALMGTRSARGSHAGAELCSMVGARNFAFITIDKSSKTFDSDKQLSMSWWLSKHVQKFLDEQLDPEIAQINAVAFDKIRKWRKKRNQIRGRGNLN